MSDKDFDDVCRALGVDQRKLGLGWSQTRVNAEAEWRDHKRTRTVVVERRKITTRPRTVWINDAAPTDDQEPVADERRPSPWSCASAALRSIASDETVKRPWEDR